MITREMLIDAVGRLMADVTDGTWGLSDDCMHPAIVELYDHLPAASEPGATRPLRALLDADKLGPEHVGYLLVTGFPDGEWPTIASVEQLGLVAGSRGPENVTRVTLVEYPGYHLDLTGGILLRAGDAHPDLIDRDGDTWRWREGYALGAADMVSRREVERDYGPVRDA